MSESLSAKARNSNPWVTNPRGRSRSQQNRGQSQPGWEAVEQRVCLQAVRSPTGWTQVIEL
jgi:hypothetical protein